MANIFDMFKKGIEEAPPSPVYSFELYGKNKDREPILAWINMETGEWIHDDFKGMKLPKGSIKEIGDYAGRYQKELLDKGQFLPQNPTPPQKINKDTKERGALKRIFSYIKDM